MFNNEEIGVSAEIAIADIFGIPITDSYRSRGNVQIIEALKPIIKDIFAKHNIPEPIKHIAADGQNPIDFMLAGNQTLSVKTNQKKLGKVAPQKVGQASSKTFFPFFNLIINANDIPESYADKVQLFKNTVYTSLDKMLKIYWDNLFDCDFLIFFYEIIKVNGDICDLPKFAVFSKRESPDWDLSKITFTKQNIEGWNESNTVKYEGVTIGEFQVHNNRDNFKFRFNMANISELMAKGII